MSKLKKIVDEAKNHKLKEIDLSDRGIQNINEVPGLIMLEHLTHLTMSYNKLSAVPPSIGELVNLELLNLFSNSIEELPTSLSGMQKLKILNLGWLLTKPIPDRSFHFFINRQTQLSGVGLLNNLPNFAKLECMLTFEGETKHETRMNRLGHLPRGFGSFPKLEMLDLTYNNLSEQSLPSNFFVMTTLRTLYLSDNDFETFPAEISKLQDLQILALRDNDLISVPKEIGQLSKLKELHIQGNRMTVLPPELGNLELTGSKNVFKADRNPWVFPIQEQFMLGATHVFDYIRSDTYGYLYKRHIHADPAPPPKKDDKSKKISRKPLKK